MPLYSVVLDRFEGDKAVLIFSDSTQLIIDRDKLGVEFKEGDVLDITLVKNESLAAEQAQLMRKKLAEILNKTNETT